MILAGGMSTRLYPLTKKVPKPLVPVAGEPITAHIMRWLRSYGYTEIGMNVHYHAEQILDAFGGGAHYGVSLEYLHEEKLMGSAGAIKPLEWFFDETFVVVGCDDLTDADLTKLVAFHKQRNALATIGLVMAEEVDQYGVVITDKRGRIVEFQEKPAKGTERSKLVNTGIYVFEPEVFKYIPAATFYDFGKGVFPALLENGADFYGLHLTKTYWRDIGTPPEYRAANEDVLTGRLTLPGVHLNSLPSDVVLGRDARIVGEVRLGANVEIGEGARIVGPTVIGNGVRIGAEASIERSIVWDAASIGERALVIGSIVGTDYDVAADTSLIDRIVANEPIAS